MKWIGGPRLTQPTLAWRFRRSLQHPMQRLMMVMAKRYDLYLVRGLRRLNLVDAERFLTAPFFSIATDYVRNATLDLICREIEENKVSGSLAEVGVYQGDFALLMHSHLPARRIHLFDTFEGFASQDVATDKHHAYVEQFVEKLHDFSNTSAARVAARFPSSSEVLLHVGWFPDSAASVEEEAFALVSLDADLYNPIFAGLQWFWPRLSPGGSMLVHDYNNAAFKGAKAAVTDFLRLTPGASSCPIPDISGSAVISKPLETSMQASAAFPVLSNPTLEQAGDD